jgi:hypothetical protein
MGRVKDIFTEAPKPSGIYEAVVAEDAVDMHTPVSVIVASFDQDLTWGPAYFTPRVDIDGALELPAEGDRCVIALAQTVDPGEHSIWILSYTTNDA